MAEIGLEQSHFAGKATAVLTRPGAKTLGRQTATLVGATALVAICAHVSVPLGFTPVPVTLQPFAVLLLGLLLAPGAAFAALTLYLLEGACGLPVFSPHGPGGLLQLFGPTGGYLLAAPFAAAAASALYRLGRRSATSALLGAGAGDFILLATGALWLSILQHVSAAVLLHQAVLPFLGSDALKVIAAALCAQIFLSLRTRPDSTTDREV